MNQSKTRHNTAALLGAALVASLGLSQSVNAQPGSSLFSATDLSHGYMAMVGEGKCGGDKKDDDKKDAEGKCGEGKCGGDTGDEKDGEGKCGEGKCGSA
jgi:uncharacterized low-complexity protein